MLPFHTVRKRRGLANLLCERTQLRSDVEKYYYIIVLFWYSFAQLHVDLVLVKSLVKDSLISVLVSKLKGLLKHF